MNEFGGWEVVWMGYVGLGGGRRGECFGLG